MHDLPFSFREFGTQEKCPVIEPFLQQLGGQAVGSFLEGLGVIHGQKGVILFSERDAGSIQFGFEKGVAVNPVGGLEREKGGDS